MIIREGADFAAVLGTIDEAAAAYRGVIFSHDEKEWLLRRYSSADCDVGVADARRSTERR